jgi:hypothetical protein
VFAEYEGPVLEMLEHVADQEHPFDELGVPPDRLRPAESVTEEDAANALFNAAALDGEPPNVAVYYAACLLDREEISYAETWPVLEAWLRVSGDEARAGLWEAVD